MNNLLINQLWIVTVPVESAVVDAEPAGLEGQRRQVSAGRRRRRHQLRFPAVRRLGNAVSAVAAPRETCRQPPETHQTLKIKKLFTFFHHRYFQELHQVFRIGKIVFKSRIKKNQIKLKKSNQIKKIHLKKMVFIKCE